MAGKQLLELMARNVAGSQAEQMLCIHLAIDQIELLGIYQRIKAGLGGIARPAEHGFAKKYPPQRHPVQTAHQDVILVPAFIGLCVPGLEQLAVGFNHGR